MFQHLPYPFHRSLEAKYPLTVVSFLLMRDQNLLLVDRFNDMALRFQGDIIILAEILADSTDG